MCLRQGAHPAVGSLTGLMGIAGKKKIAHTSMYASYAVGGIQHLSVPRRKAVVQLIRSDVKSSCEMTWLGIRCYDPINKTLLECIIV